MTDLPAELDDRSAPFISEDPAPRGGAVLYIAVAAVIAFALGVLVGGC